MTSIRSTARVPTTGIRRTTRRSALMRDAVIAIQRSALLAAVALDPAAPGRRTICSARAGGCIGCRRPCGCIAVIVIGLRWRTLRAGVSGARTPDASTRAPRPSRRRREDCTRRRGGRASRRHPVRRCSSRASSTEPRARLAGASSLTIDVTGHQWWWEVEVRRSAAQPIVHDRQRDSHPGRPAGRFELTLADVIHSFWVPNLHGKSDSIPGTSTSIWLQADQPGVFRGQCAEFCGLQHAHMASSRRRSRRRIRRWLADQLTAAASRPTRRARRAARCSCTRPCAHVPHDPRHDAGAPLGPDLTHLASRGTHRRRHAAKHRGQPGRLDRRSAGDQAGRADAAECSCRATICSVARRTWRG